jgi:beta-1,4-mannosyltransferase
LVSFLSLAKSLGIKIIWTVHNLEHHEKTTYIDKLGYRILAKHSSLLICHSEETATKVAGLYKAAQKCVVMRHGTYDNAHPSPRPRGKVLRELGLSEHIPTFCQLGLIRTYKGIDVVVDAASLLTQPIQIIIAGAVHADFDINAIRRKQNLLKNTLLIEGFLNEQEFADIAAASDGFLLPYKKITGSGLALASITFKKGFIASRLPYFEQLLSDNPNAGRLFEQNNPRDMADAINSYMQLNEEHKSRAISSIAAAHQWSKCIIPVADRLRDLPATSK